MTTAYLNRIATAVPEHDLHDAFATYAEHMLVDPRLRNIFRCMISRAEIAHRYSFLELKFRLLDAVNHRETKSSSILGWL